ncbi:hypothetical protein BST81_17725 [Leptolyngbya sp. 'hensonii']|uniref:hypothetical protein n=1 Tax=Leptolyngbya sp. 'hensonii' TaxID=1922337 RepID=UPI0009502F12|nr:hypothetical protein [Leptolyngbya sp. 'hensonii']OLP17188.1 hypothetical protein BST81_17725 [Leptolyngbya sp. 'hensonii']
MEYWEFLLQKEGDRSWLPLESPDVEILEGRYRVVARTSRANSDVEIRITHVATDETPPKRRVQKQTRRTNAEGLMVVFPFTRLQPGLWQLDCTADLMMGLMGDDWHQSVSLQVLSVEAESEMDWQMDWSLGSEVATEWASSPQATSEAAIVAPLPEPTPLEASERTLVVVEKMDAESEELTVRFSASPELVLPQVQSTDEMTQVQVSPSASAPFQEDKTVSHAWDSPLAGTSLDQQVLRLNLPAESFMAYWGQQFFLAGQVEVQRGYQLPEEAVCSWPAEVQVCLRDPQTLQVLATAFQGVTLSYGVTLFACAVDIPADCQTRLLLGEISLFTAEAEAEPSLTPLITQSFIVTAALDELLEALATHQEEELEEVDGSAAPSYAVVDAMQVNEPAKPASRLNMALLNLVKTPKPQQPIQFRPAAHQPLPPRLYRPSEERVPHKSPQLPVIRKNQPLGKDFAPVRTAPIDPPAPSLPGESLKVGPEPTGQADLTDLEVTLADDLRALQLAEPVTGAVEPEQLDAAVESDRVDPLASSEGLLPGDMPTQDSIENFTLAEDRPVATTLRPLNLQERFLNRLNALAEDAELSQQLRDACAEPEVGTSDELPPPADLEPSSDAWAEESTEPLAPVLFTPEEPEVHPVLPEDEWAAREIVVDDDLAPGAEPIAEQVPESAVLVLSPDADPVPVPDLEIPAGELIAEKPVNVRVRLPGQAPRASVKVWINDRQTNSLLDGPWSLVNFTPDGNGQIEATMQLQVPPGSLEVQFEAIAIELHSQRQSRKATCSRMVIPPDLPDLGLDELDDL